VPRSANDRLTEQFVARADRSGMAAGSWWPPGRDERGMWMRGWWKLIFPAVFLVNLLQTVNALERYSSGFAVAAGYVVLVAFCVVYLAAIPFTWGGERKLFWWLYTVLLVLFAVEIPLAHEGASVMLIFVVILTVSSLGLRAVPVVGVYVVLATVGPSLVPGWDVGLDTNSAVTIPVVALAMFGFFGVVQANRALTAAREEVARLAAENERTRIARDLHDLLGHSLTTITMKAALAHRLADRDIERASQEMAEVEELSRVALAEVRAAVANYREASFAGELATGRELLRAAGIDANLPTAIDAVDPANQALFGWVVREGLTNVVRHARATSCAVSVGCDWIEIADDGRGAGSGSGADGNGLRGLRERVTAAGGTLVAGPAERGGWRLRVDAPVTTRTRVDDAAPSPAVRT
jgi:two-component system sensor histidine kinase DesK